MSNIIVKCAKVTIQPMGWRMTVYLGEKGLEHMVKLWGEAVEDTSGMAFFATTEDGHMGMWFREWTGDSNSYECLYHESLHCATHLWHTAGANLHVHHNDEVLTYTMGHIANEVEQALEFLSEYA